MVERACEQSRFPDRIKGSVVEFLLPKPSYTIETLRYLTEEHGSQMRFSLLMGADLVPQLPQWKEWRQIVEHYPIYVYPRGEGNTKETFADGFTRLDDAPLVPYSASDVREAMRVGQEHYRNNRWGEALNVFNRVLEMSPWHAQAQQMVEMIQEILVFRHKDFYNP